MHIAIVSLFPLTPEKIDGGVAGVSRYLSAELIKNDDVKLTVVVPKGATGKDIAEKWGDLNILRIAKKGFWRFLPGNLYDLVTGKRQLHKILKEIDPDIVHFQGCAYYAANYKAANVLTIHGIIENDAKWDASGFKGFVRYLMHKATECYSRSRIPYLILISEYVKEFFAGKNKLRKTWLIENPISDTYFNMNWNPAPFRIFCCGRIILRKNTLNIIKAFGLISKKFPEAQLIIAGSTVVDPDYVAKCKHQVNELGLGDKVHFLGNVSIQTVQEELIKANCLVMPSYQETAPLAIEEAMAVGVPVVTSNSCGMPYMVEQGNTGFLIDPNDSEGIADAVSKILSDESLAASMSARARKLSRERFMASKIAEQTLAVYNEILSGEC